MTIRHKVNALSKQERGKVCTHDHAPYSGQIPCTGPRQCSMCGMTFRDDAELAEAQEEARGEILKANQEQPTTPGGRAMSIEISTEKIVRGRTKMRRIVHVKALKGRELPQEYLEDSRSVRLAENNQEIVKVKAIGGTGLVVKEGEEMAEGQFLECLRKLREAGKLLHEIQEEGRRLEKEWSGRETYII